MFCFIAGYCIQQYYPLKSYETSGEVRNLEAGIIYIESKPTINITWELPSGMNVKHIYHWLSYHVLLLKGQVTSYGISHAFVTVTDHVGALLLQLKVQPCHGPGVHSDF